MEFVAFPKIARFSREVIVTEKIDGTNGQIAINEAGEFRVGSRERWITPEDDNHGFAAWAYAHKDELMGLGVGRHAGEWWGCLTRETSVRLADGSLEKIGKIVNNKLEVEVMSYNFATGVIEPKRVVGYKVAEKTDDWLTIEFKRKHKGGNQPHLNVTPNHILYTKDDSGLIREISAGELKVGDRVFLAGKRITELQKQLLFGSNVGDGSTGGYSFHVGHSNHDLVDEEISVLGGLISNVRFQTIWESLHASNACAMQLIETEVTAITRDYANANRCKNRYDIEVEDNHNFFANGVLVHNSGIQRKYGLVNDDKRFSLFNVQRWCLQGQEPKQIQMEDPRVVKRQEVLPACVGLVPVLWRGKFDDLDIPAIMDGLRENGSGAVKGFQRPEGIVIYHVAGNVGFKKTLGNDDIPKSRVRGV